MNQNQLEIEKSKIDFKYLWKIKEIDVNIIKLEKYEIQKLMSNIDTTKYSNVILKYLIGTETHKAIPDVQLELSGKVGEIIKNFEVGKHNGSVKIKKIVWL